MSGAQQAPDTQLVPDGNVDRILDRENPPLEGEEVGGLVETLEEVSKEHLLPIY